MPDQYHWYFTEAHYYTKNNRRTIQNVATNQPLTNFKLHKLFQATNLIARANMLTEVGKFGWSMLLHTTGTQK